MNERRANPSAARTIDLNCDLGESEDAAGIACDAAVMAVITSANIACGGHAGDAVSMARTVELAARHGVSIGAHPSYADRARFGRMETGLDAAGIYAVVSEQVRALMVVAGRCGAQVGHVKPHGALYHRVSVDFAAAEAMGRAVLALGGAGAAMAMMGLAGSAGNRVWEAMGLEVWPEGLADRRYEPDGSLTARTKPGAMVTDEAQVLEQVLAIARGEGVTASDGSRVLVAARTVCVHSDTPGAARLARAIRTGLEAGGVVVTTASSHSRGHRP